MRILIAYILTSLVVLSCKTTESTTSEIQNSCFCNFASLGVDPIELSPCDTTIRIWIDNSSTVRDAITIYRDSLGYYGNYSQYGVKYKNRLFGGIKVKSVFNFTELFPRQGWEKFIDELNESDFFQLGDRKWTVGDGAPFHHGMTIYLVEIKTAADIDQYQFYSFFPSPNYPDDMTQYKNIERIILTSFVPLNEKLRLYQQEHGSRWEYEY